MSRRIMRIVPFGQWWEVKCDDCGPMLPLWGQRGDAEKASRAHRVHAHKDEPKVGYLPTTGATVKPNSVIHYPVEAPLRHRHPFSVSDLPGVGATVARSLRESA